MAYLSVQGIPHYYEWVTDAANHERTGKPVLVFIHGWGGSARYWESTAQTLAPYYDCLLYDLRGFGRSSREKRPDPMPVQSPGYELVTFAEDLASLLDQLGIDRVILNAHSMGASIATLFLNRYPERTDRAILTCSGIFEYDEVAFKAFYKFGGYVVKFRPRWLYSLPGMDRLFMQRFLHRPLPSSISRAFLDDFLMADDDTALGTIFTCVSQQAAEEMPQEFANLQIPTLLIAGERDIIIPARLGEHAASLSQKIQLVVMPNTAHFPMLEDASTYLHHVQQFLGVDAVNSTATVN